MGQEAPHHLHPPDAPSASRRRRPETGGTNRRRTARYGWNTASPGWSGPRSSGAETARLRGRTRDPPRAQRLGAANERPSDDRFRAGAHRPSTSPSRSPCRRDIEPDRRTATAGHRPVAETPIGKRGLGRHLLQVPDDLLHRHLRQGGGTARLQEPFDPTDIPRAHLLRDAAAGQEVQVAVPIGRSAVLAAGSGKGRHDNGSHMVGKASSEFSLLH